MKIFHMWDVASLLGLPMPPSGRSSYYVQCPCCDESPRKKHLNINLKKEVFRCPRCGVSGGIFDLYSLYIGAGIRTDIEVSTPQKVAASAGQRTSIPYLIMLFLMLIMLDFCMALPQHLPSLAISFGRGAAFGAMLVSASMVGNVLGKIVLGVLNDSIGVFATTIIGAFSVALGCFCITTQRNVVIITAAAFIGIILSVVTLQVPLLCRGCCSPALYNKIYPAVCSVNIVVGAASHTILSFGYNVFNSYRPVMLLAMGNMFICILITVVISKWNKSSFM